MSREKKSRPFERRKSEIYEEQESNNTDDEEFSKVTPTKEPWTNSDDTDAQQKNLSEELDSDEMTIRNSNGVEKSDDESSMTSERPKRVKRRRTRLRTSNREISHEKIEKKRKRGNKTRKRYKNEVPITEILKKAQERCYTKYEEPVPLPELTTDTIYIQRKNGFSAIKITDQKNSRDEKQLQKDKKDRSSYLQHSCPPPIIVAISAAKCWKCFGLIYQGILGGMAFAHFLMIQTFFERSIYFVSQYSTFSEIYTSLFSFLIVLCVVSIFDKFDVARLSVDHLNDIYILNMKSVLAIPLYLAALCLHEVSSMMDDRLALLHYHHINESLWFNDSHVETVLDDLANWQGITISKDLLALLGWCFVSIGTSDDMLLMYLESMKKYATDVFSNRSNG